MLLCVDFVFFCFTEEDEHVEKDFSKLLKVFSSLYSESPLMFGTVKPPPITPLSDTADLAPHSFYVTLIVPSEVLVETIYANKLSTQ